MGRFKYLLSQGHNVPNTVSNIKYIFKDGKLKDYREGNFSDITEGRGLEEIVDNSLVT